MGHLINLSLVFHTIRHLKFKQVFYRTYYYFLKPTKGKNTHPCLRNVTILYSFPSYIEPATLDGHVFKFLNHKARISKRWNFPLCQDTCPLSNLSIQTKAGGGK